MEVKVSLRSALRAIYGRRLREDGAHVAGGRQRRTEETAEHRRAQLLRRRRGRGDVRRTQDAVEWASGWCSELLFSL